MIEEFLKHATNEEGRFQPKQGVVKCPEF